MTGTTVTNFPMPEGIKLVSYSDCFLVEGVGLTNETAFAAIEALPEAIKERVMGWKCLGADRK